MSRCSRQPLHLDDKLKKFYLRYVNWWRRTTSGKKIFRLAYWTTDIAKAYDHVTFELVERGLTKKGAPKPIIAARLRECSQMKSPAIFVASMDILLERFLEICKERGLGFHDQGLWLPVLAFADNIWLFAKTPNELEQMFRAWIAVMREKWSENKNK